MKIKLETKRFQNAVKTVKAIVNQKSIIVSLVNLHFHMEDGEMCISSSNLENTLSIKIPYDSDDMGEYEFMIECSILDKIVSKIKDASFCLEMNDIFTRGTIIIKRGSFDFPIIPPESINFTNLSESQFNNADEFIMDRDTFLKAVKMSQKFQCTDAAHVNICGTFVKANGNTISVYATDRSRLVRIVREIKSNLEKEVSFIIPQMSSVLVQSLSMGSDTIQFKCSEKNIKVSNDSVVLIFQNLEMPYPKCDAIIPTTDSENYLLANRAELADCFSQAQLCGGENNNAVRFEHKGRQVLISSQNIAMGRNADLELTTDFIKENTMEDNFYVGLISDGIVNLLNAPDSENIKLYFTQKNKPVIIREVNKDWVEDRSTDMLIMPILI